MKRPCCPRSFNYGGSDNSTIEAQLHGFRTRYLRFAVQVTHAPRKTRSRLLVKLCRTGISPVEAPTKGFILNFSWKSSFHELLGAMNGYIEYTAAGLQCPVATLGRAWATPANPTLWRAWLRLDEDISNWLQHNRLQERTLFCHFEA